jgi:hypothetical protein
MHALFKINKTGSPEGIFLSKDLSLNVKSLKEVFLYSSTEITSKPLI